MYLQKIVGILELAPITLITAVYLNVSIKLLKPITLVPPVRYNVFHLLFTFCLYFHFYILNDKAFPHLCIFNNNVQYVVISRQTIYFVLGWYLNKLISINGKIYFLLEFSIIIVGLFAFYSVLRSFSFRLW